MATKFLNNININDAYTLPASDGTDGQVMTTDGSGALSFTTVGDGEAVKIHVKNTSGATITKGQPVYITGNVGNSDRLEVSLADAGDATKMPAVGLLESDLSDDGEGDVVVTGFLKGIDTTAIDGSNGGSGDVVYVKPSGGLTYTKPTGTNLIQNIAKVGRDHSNGSLVVTSIMRTNDVPNIAENYVWLGNSSGVATATEHLLNNVKDVTTSSPTDGQVLTWDGTNSYWKNADSAGGSGGGSDTGTVTIEKDVFDSAHATDPTDGSNTTFDLTSAPAGKNNLQVYVDGVYQAKENFSLSGSTITISPAPPSGVELEVIHIKAITGQITLDKFDGDNSTTAFSMSQSINNENNLQVYINGVYQSKDTYSTSGSTLTLTTAPTTGAKIEVVHIKPVDVTSMTSDLFTGDDSTTAFDLTATPSAAGKTMVFIQGVYQEKSTYSISGNTITFTTAPPDGYTVEVTTFGKLAVSENTVTVERFTGDDTETSFVLTSSPSANNVDVYISGLYQNKNSYTYSAGTITFDEAPDTGAVVEAKYIANITQVVAADNDFYKFQWVPTAQTANFTAVANRGYFIDVSSAAITVTLPSSPSVGDVVSLIDYAGNASTNNITVTSSDDIMDSADDKVIDYDNGAVGLVYSGSTKGWLVASAANETAEALADTNITVDYLVVGGGGAGGGSWRGGGGGAGAVRTSYASQGGGAAEADALSLSLSTNYTVTVGGGGSGSSEADGAKGTDSTFATITASGGGGGAGGYNTSDAPSYTGNGSGGGGNGYTNTGDSAGSSSGTYGNDGGDGGPDSGQCGGGGGGAGAAGINGGSASTAGDGGNGIIVNILNSTNAAAASVGDVQSTNVYYGGGGGGGSYSNGNNAIPGLGGGGDGGYGTTSTNADEPDAGSSNTGGGGGGCAEESSFGTGTGGNGGSGVVVLRYPSSKSITVGSGLTQPSGSPFTEGSDKISVFTLGTGTISFS